MEHVNTRTAVTVLIDMRQLANLESQLSNVISLLVITIYTVDGNYVSLADIHVCK